MHNRFLLDMLWVLGVVLATGIGWLLVRHGAQPNERAAVESALRQATIADLESITVYPLVPGPAGAARPFQVSRAAQLRPLVPALRQLRPLAVNERTFRPLLQATVLVRLLAAPAAARHLRSRTIALRLAVSAQGEVVQLAQTNNFYQATALSQRLQQLRDSLATP